jgi:hypothetical protein
MSLAVTLTHTADRSPWPHSRRRARTRKEGLMTDRRSHQPNQALAELLDGCGMSRKGLAHRVNQLAKQAGLRTAYKHSSIARWLGGETPQTSCPPSSPPR